MIKETLKTTQQRGQNGSEIVTCSSGAGHGSQEHACHLPRGRSTHPSVTNLRSRHLLSPPLAGLATSQRGQSWANSATCWRRVRTARVPILPTTQDGAHQTPILFPAPSSSSSSSHLPSLFLTLGLCAVPTAWNALPPGILMADSSSFGSPFKRHL